MLYLGQDPRYDFCQLCSWKCAFWYLVSLKLHGSDWFMNLLILRANNLSQQIFRGVASLLFLWFHSYLPPRARTSTHSFWEWCSLWWLHGYLSLLLPPRHNSNLARLAFSFTFPVILPARCLRSHTLHKGCWCITWGRMVHSLSFTHSFLLYMPWFLGWLHHNQ